MGVRSIPLHLVFVIDGEIKMRKQMTTFLYTCQICDDETNKEYLVKELTEHYKLHTKAEMIHILLRVSASIAKYGEYA